MSRAIQTYHRTINRPSYGFSETLGLDILVGRLPAGRLAEDYAELALALVHKRQVSGILQPGGSIEVAS